MQNEQRILKRESQTCRNVKKWAFILFRNNVKLKLKIYVFH